MGRSHDYFCMACRAWWSPFTWKVCPGCGTAENSFYDLNYEGFAAAIPEVDEPAPLPGSEEE